MVVDRQAVEADICAHLDRGSLDAAITALLQGYGREILGYLTAVLRDDDLADEAFSQFTEDAWSGLARFRRESSARTWAYTLAWHVALRLIKDPYKRRAQRWGTSQWSGLAQEIRASTAAHKQTTMKDRVAALREQLAPDEQTLLILRLDRELSWKEIAEVMAEAGVPPASEPALRKRFERVKDKLRDLARADGLLER
jgi:RNA polymerase sigma-70 factor (ECF subfamily)